MVGIDKKEEKIQFISTNFTFFNHEIYFHKNKHTYGYSINIENKTQKKIIQV